MVGPGRIDYTLISRYDLLGALRGAEVLDTPMRMSDHVAVTVELGLDPPTPQRRQEYRASAGCMLEVAGSRCFKRTVPGNQRSIKAFFGGGSAGAGAAASQGKPLEATKASSFSCTAAPAAASSSSSGDGGEGKSSSDAPLPPAEPAYLASSSEPDGTLLPSALPLVPLPPVQSIESRGTGASGQVEPSNPPAKRAPPAPAGGKAKREKPGAGGGGSGKGKATGKGKAPAVNGKGSLLKYLGKPGAKTG